jgi:hypothetical protein
MLPEEPTNSPCWRSTNIDSSWCAGCQFNFNDSWSSNKWVSSSSVLVSASASSSKIPTIKKDCMNHPGRRVTAYVVFLCPAVSGNDDSSNLVEKDRVYRIILKAAKTTTTTTTRTIGTTNCWRVDQVVDMTEQHQVPTIFYSFCVIILTGCWSKRITTMMELTTHRPLPFSPFKRSYILSSFKLFANSFFYFFTFFIFFF